MDIRHHTKSQILLEDVPMFGPVAAYSLIGAGLVLVLVILSRYPWKTGMALFGGVASLVGLVLLLRQQEQSRISVDRDQKQLHILRKKPLRPSHQEHHPLEGLAAFHVEAAPSSQKHRIVAEMQDGSRIPFTRRWLAKSPVELETTCRTLMQFVGK